MSAFAKALRRLLARRGYEVSRVEQGRPETLDSYLESWVRRGVDFKKVCAFDSDPEVPKAFAAAFPAAEMMSFSGADTGDVRSQIPTEQGTIVEIDLAVLTGLNPAEAAASFSGLRVIVVRSKLGLFWDRRFDLLDVCHLMSGCGFRLEDVVRGSDAGLLFAPNRNVFLAFERSEAAIAPDKRAADDRAYRVSEALNQLSSPVIHDISLSRLTGRGSLGFAAGVYNPGAVQTDQGYLLLARGEKDPWHVQKHDKDRFLQSGRPVIIGLQRDLRISRTEEVRWAGVALPGEVRREDFRLFRHRDRIYSNHSIVHLDSNRNDGETIKPERLRTSVGISVLDADQALLTPLGTPVLDRPVARLEKNWAMFSDDRQVHLIYSFNPYRLFTAAAFPELEFRVRIECELKLPLAGDGLAFRNSLNPVPYDADHLLHVVHKAYPGKHYVFWAVLIDRRTLTPVKMIPRPLLRAGASARASIIYACSAVSLDGEILLFSGLDDCSIGAWRVPHRALDGQWAAIA